MEGDERGKERGGGGGMRKSRREAKRGEWLWMSKTLMQL